MYRGLGLRLRNPSPRRKTQALGAGKRRRFASHRPPHQTSSLGVPLNSDSPMIFWIVWRTTSRVFLYELMKVFTIGTS